MKEQAPIRFRNPRLVKLTAAGLMTVSALSFGELCHELHEKVDQNVQATLHTQHVIEPSSQAIDTAQKVLVIYQKKPQAVSRDAVVEAEKIVDQEKTYKEKVSTAIETDPTYDQFPYNSAGIPIIGFLTGGLLFIEASKKIPAPKKYRPRKVKVEKTKFLISELRRGLQLVDRE